MTNYTDLIAFLNAANKKIKALEAQALEFLEQGNNPAHLECMQQKAQLLAGLSTNSQPYLQTLPEGVKREVQERLEAFSKSAARSLEIGSVFFMSALLYPDEHKKGEPNNLEIFIQELETQI